MQIVIEISEDDYKEVKEDTYSGTPFENRVFSAIANGKPLPKGHGRLIDEKEVYKKFYCRCLAGVAKEVLEETSTIIEADGGDAE